MPEDSWGTDLEVDLLPEVPQPEKLGRAKLGFLTPLDKSTLQSGPTFRQTTRREYGGPRIKRLKRAHEVRYAKARSKAIHGLAAALEDALFTAQVLDPDALYAALLMATAKGNPPPFPLLLEAIAGRIGLERVPQDREGGAVKGGAFAVVAFLAALERGLNVEERGSGQRHALIHTLRAEPEAPARGVWEPKRERAGTTRRKR